MKYKSNDIILLGAGGHARVIIDIISNYHKELNIIGLLEKDARMPGSTLDGCKILGDDSLLQNLYNEGVEKAFIAVGNTGFSSVREALYETVTNIGFELVNVIHGLSCIAGNAAIGKGNAVMAQAVVNPGAVIGNNCIINTGSIIEHGCILGDNVHIATGAKLAGDVKAGDGCMVGMGASIIQGITIGDRAVIGAGSVVTRDIPADSVAFGVPARIIRMRGDQLI